MNRFLAVTLCLALLLASAPPARAEGSLSEQEFSDVFRLPVERELYEKQLTPEQKAAFTKRFRELYGKDDARSKDLIRSELFPLLQAAAKGGKSEDPAMKKELDSYSAFPSLLARNEKARESLKNKDIPALRDAQAMRDNPDAKADGNTRQNVVVSTAGGKPPISNNKAPYGGGTTPEADKGPTKQQGLRNQPPPTPTDTKPAGEKEAKLDAKMKDTIKLGGLGALGGALAGIGFLPLLGPIGILGGAVLGAGLMVAANYLSN